MIVLAGWLIFANRFAFISFYVSSQLWWFQEFFVVVKPGVGPGVK